MLKEIKKSYVSEVIWHKEWDKGFKDGFISLLATGAIIYMAIIAMGVTKWVLNFVFGVGAV